MNTYIFLYPETSFFEVNLAAYFMKTKGNVFIVTERENKIVYTNEGVRILSDAFIDEVNVEDIDVFIICGGEIKNISNKPLLYKNKYKVWWMKSCKKHLKPVLRSPLNWSANSLRVQDKDWVR